MLHQGPHSLCHQANCHVLRYHLNQSPRCRRHSFLYKSDDDVNKNKTRVCFLKTQRMMRW